MNITVMKFKIRNIYNDDILLLSKLSGELGYHISEEKISRNIKEISNYKQNIFVARDNSSRVIGFVQVCITPFFFIEPAGEILGLIVEKQYRSKNAGTMLLQAAEKWCVEQGVKKIKVNSRAERTRAHAFYRKNGYILKKTQKYFEKKINGRRNYSEQKQLSSVYAE
jgi:ribosomal protein S18 acetylase RimI-like enzyme